MKKKAIEPVVAILLLVVVTVISAVAFQIYFKSIQDGTFIRAENDKTSYLSKINIGTIVGNQLYTKNDNGVPIEVIGITINGNGCPDNSSLATGFVNRTVTGCVSSGLNDIVIITPYGVISERVRFDY